MIQEGFVTRVDRLPRLVPMLWILLAAVGIGCIGMLVWKWTEEDRMRDQLTDLKSKVTQLVDEYNDILDTFQQAVVHQTIAVLYIGPRAERYPIHVRTLTVNGLRPDKEIQPVWGERNHCYESEDERCSPHLVNVDGRFASSFDIRGMVHPETKQIQFQSIAIGFRQGSDTLDEDTKNYVYTEYGDNSVQSSPAAHFHFEEVEQDVGTLESVFGAGGTYGHLEVNQAGAFQVTIRDLPPVDAAWPTVWPVRKTYEEITRESPKTA